MTQTTTFLSILLTDIKDWLTRMFYCPALLTIGKVKIFECQSNDGIWMAWVMINTVKISKVSRLRAVRVERMMPHSHHATYSPEVVSTVWIILCTKYMCFANIIKCLSHFMIILIRFLWYTSWKEGFQNIAEVYTGIHVSNVLK